MAKGKARRRFSTHQPRSTTPYSVKSAWGKGSARKKTCKPAEKKDWEDVTCSVCMECPHNAVLLLCSSHDKGCRPYMCGTSYRYSNCLDQFKKAYAKTAILPSAADLSGLVQQRPVVSDSEELSMEDAHAGNGNRGLSQPSEKWELSELACPLCRGKVKGWTVVESARAYLNTKKRSCMQDCCSFVGNYDELRKHVRADHPCARPREVDPVLQQNWRRLEHERDHDDVLSTISATMPGAMVLGDYVIEGHGLGNDEDDPRVDDNNLLNVLLLFQAFGSAGNLGGGRSFSSRLRRLSRNYRRLGIGSPLGRSNWGDNTLDSITISSDDEDESLDTTAAADDTDSRGRMRNARLNRGSSARRRRTRRRSLTDLT